jgi:hypothetical protein
MTGVFRTAARAAACLVQALRRARFRAVTRRGPSGLEYSSAVAVEVTTRES